MSDVSWGQVETVGEVYMVVAGCPVQTTRHAERACLMALAMCECLEALRRDVEAKLGVPAKELNIRIGLNTGPIVAGVVGISNPRCVLPGKPPTVGALCRSVRACACPCVLTTMCASVARAVDGSCAKCASLACPRAGTSCSVTQ